MAKGFFKRFFTFRSYLIGAIIAAAVLTFFAKQYAFFSFDLYITRAIQQLPENFFGDILLFISWLGNYYQAQISLLIACVIFTLLRRFHLAAGIFLSTVGAVLIAETIKTFVGRPRPNPLLINQLEKFFKDDSFPSGHVLFAMGFYGFLLFATFVLIRDKLWRNIISGIWLTVIILMGVSRIYKGSHWFSDTLASYLIGSVWLYAVIFISYKLVKKDKIEPKEIKVEMPEQLKKGS